MTTALAAALLIGFLCAVAGAVAWLLDDRPGAAIPTVLLASMLVLLVFGLVNLLWLGFPFVLLLGLGIVVKATLDAARRGKLRVLFKSLIDPAVAMFIGATLMLRVFMRGMRFHGWDEFSHWGTTARATFEHQSISIHNPVDLAFRAYPPALTLVEYLVSSFRGAFVEADAIWAVQVLIFSLATGLVARVPWNRVWLLLIGMLAGFGIPLWFFGASVYSTFSDPPLTVLFGYCLTVAVIADIRKRATWVHLAVGIAGLVLAKDAGVVLALVAAAAFWVRVVQARRGDMQLSVRGPVLTPLAGLVFALVWRLAVAVTHAQRPFRQVVQDAPADYRLITWQRFRDALGSGWMGHSHVPLTWWEWMALILLLLALAGRLARGSRYRVRPIGIVIVAGYVTYTAFLLLSYLFLFMPGEAVVLASYGRYVGPYLGGLVWLGMASLISWCLAAEGRTIGTRTLAVFTIAGLFAATINWVPVAELAKGEATRASQTLRVDYDKVLPILTALPNDARIWLVVEQSGGFEYWVIRHGLDTRRVNPNFTWNLRPSAPPNPPQSPYVRSAAQWLSEIDQGGYDYVYVFRTSDEFLATYTRIFNAKPSSETLFKVVRDGERVRLVRQGA